MTIEQEKPINGLFDSQVLSLALEEVDIKTPPANVLDAQPSPADDNVESKSDDNQTISSEEKVPIKENTQENNGENVEEVNILAPARAEENYIAIAGHTQFLFYNENGLPYIVQSSPNTLGIAHESALALEVYIPVIKHEVPPLATPVSPSETPAEICCSNPVPIIFDPLISGEGLPTGSHSQLASDFSTLLNAAFQFTFQACEDSPSTILFTPNADGIAALEALEDQATNSFDPEPTVVPTQTTLQIVDATDCGLPAVNCDNPIVQIDIVFAYPTRYETTVTNINDLPQSNFHISSIPYTLPSLAVQIDIDELHITSGKADDFVTHEVYSVWFLDSFGNIYQLDPFGGNQIAYFPCYFDHAGPIVLDLNNHGFELTSVINSSTHLNIGGKEVQSGWIGKDNAFLTYDYSGQGQIANKNFILTDNVPGAKTDFQALESLAGQHGGIIDASNPIFSKLGAWQDSNSNGAMDKGEYHTLSQLGIVSINLTETGPVQNVNGNLINGVMSFNYANGTVGKAADVSLSLHDVVQPNNSIQGLSSNAPASTSVPAAAVAAAEPAPVAPPHVDPVVQVAVDATHVAAANG